MRSRSDINNNIMRKKQTFEEKLRGLTYIGYEKGAVFSKLEFREDHIEAIIDIIRSRFEKRATINKNAPSSYRLKHCVESQVEAKQEPLNGYVSNGELIYAMILEGYDVEIDGKDAYFNLVEKSAQRLPRNPRYDEKGNVYEYNKVLVWGKRAKPVFKIDIEEYRDLINEKKLWWKFYEGDKEEGEE